MEKLGFKIIEKGFAKPTKFGDIGIHSKTGVMMKKISKDDFRVILNINK